MKETKIISAYPCCGKTYAFENYQDIYSILDSDSSDFSWIYRERTDDELQKIKEDFVLRKVADSYVVVPVNKLTLDFNGIINLNETGAFLFEKLQNDCEKADLLKAMLDEYEVSEQKASADIDSFIKKLEEADVLE